MVVCSHGSFVCFAFSGACRRKSFKDSLQEDLNLVCDWKHTNNDLNGYSCQSFSEILTELTGEQISKKWIESCFHFSGNGRINNKADTLVGFMHSLLWKTDMVGHEKTYKLPGRNNGVRIFHPIDDVSQILSTNELISKIKCSSQLTSNHIQTIHSQ